MNPRGVVLLLAFLETACGGSDVRLGDGRGSGDAERTGPRFGTPELVGVLHGDGAKDDDPSLTSDLLELYFDSKRDGGAGREDVWHASRPDADAPWSDPEPLSELDTESRETGIALSMDGRTLYFSSDRDGAGLDVFVTTRSARGEAWASPSRVDELSSDDDDLVSSVDLALTTLYLARRASEDDDYDVFVSRRDLDQDPWGEPSRVSEIDTDDEESDAYPVGDQSLVFTRDADLFSAERASADADFADAVPITDLNSDSDDRDAWVSDDFGYVVFSSDRSGEYQLYEARR